MSLGIRKRKAAFKRRAIRLGLWSRFKLARERLKREGFDPQDVVYVLIPKFEKEMDAIEAARSREAAESA